MHVGTVYSRSSLNVIKIKYTGSCTSLDPLCMNTSRLGKLLSYISFCRGFHMLPSYVYIKFDIFHVYKNKRKLAFHDSEESMQ